MKFRRKNITNHTFNNLMEKTNLGLFRYHTMLNKWKNYFGDLPEIPDGYFLPVVKCEGDIVKVINHLKEENKKIDKKYHKDYQEACFIGKSDYEDDCFFFQLAFTNIFDYWVGKLKPIDSCELECDLDILAMNFWECLKGKLSISALKKECNTAYNTYVKITNGGIN